MQSLESLIFFSGDCRKILEIYRLTILNTDTNRIFPIPLRLCTYLLDINSLKNNSAVSRSGYLYGVNQIFSLANALLYKLKVLL